MKPVRMVAALLVFASVGLLGAAPPPIPNTPAGSVFADWLDAFNSGDPVRLEEHYRTHRPDTPVEGGIRFQRMTGGFELLAIEDSDPLRLVVRVKERNRPMIAVGAFVIDGQQPAQIMSFSLRAIPPNAPKPNFEIDEALREKVIEEVIEKLEESYVFPDVSREMAEALQRRQEAGEYALVRHGDVFATLLTKHLREVSHDKHLSVGFSPVPMPEAPATRPEPDGQRDTQRRRRMLESNCGFERVEHLNGNVGYVKFNMFASPDICGPTVAAAMGLVANTKALIFDLRENGGGDPAMVAVISSYLFDKPTHLNDLWTRATDETRQFWTFSYVPGPRLPDQPVYILTSKRTFSGAEGFSYHLQQLERATIVGETTGGGAHPVRGHRIDARFSVGVPFARAINPVSKTNWEGVGVKPDIECAAADALDRALELIRNAAPTNGPR